MSRYSTKIFEYKMLLLILANTAKKQFAREAFSGSLNELYMLIKSNLPAEAINCLPTTLDSFALRISKIIDFYSDGNYINGLFLSLPNQKDNMLLPSGFSQVEMMWVGNNYYYMNRVFIPEVKKPRTIKFKLFDINSLQDLKTLITVDISLSERLFNNRLWVLSSNRTEPIKSVVTYENGEIIYLAQEVAKFNGLSCDISDIQFKHLGNINNFCFGNLDIKSKDKMDTTMSINDQIISVEDDIAGGLTSFAITDKINPRRSKIIKIPNSFNGKFNKNEWYLVDNDVVNRRDGMLLQYYLTGTNPVEVSITLKEWFWYNRSNYIITPISYNRSTAVSSAPVTIAVESKPLNLPEKLVVKKNNKKLVTETVIQHKKLTKQPTITEENTVAVKSSEPKVATYRKVEAYIIEWDEGKSSTIVMTEENNMATLKKLIAKCEEHNLDIPTLFNGLI